MKAVQSLIAKNRNKSGASEIKNLKIES